MKVLLLNGSPNPKGCTYTALCEAAKGLQENGIAVEWAHIGSGIVAGFTGRSECVAEDDALQDTIAKMKDCDGLIVGSPVYYAAPNGSLLSFLDRMFSSAGALLRYKPAAAVVSARRAGTSASLDVLNKYFTINCMPVVSSSYWNMVHGSCPEDVAKDLEGLQIMRTLGRNMAWMLKCIEAGKAAGIEPPKAEEPKQRTNFIR